MAIDRRAAMAAVAALLFLTGCQRAAPRSAVVRYVTLTGNNAAAGSAAAPWRNLDWSVSQLLPGDRLCIGPGVWSDPRDVISSQNYYVPSGEEGSVITIGACNGDDVTIKPPTGYGAIGFTYGSGGTPHHLTIQDLSIDGSLQADNQASPDGGPEMVYLSSGANHIRLERLYIAHTMSHAVQFASSNADPTIDTFNSFVDSKFEDIGNATGDSGHGGPGINNGYALYSWTARATITGNTFTNTRGTALVVYGPRNVVDRNTFVHNATRGGAGAYAVNFGSGSHPIPSVDNRFSNNLVVDNPGGGLQVYTNASVDVLNNTFVSTPNWAIHLQYCLGGSIRNNIFNGTAASILNDSPDTCKPTADHSVEPSVDPKFVNPAAGNYRLSPGSPAVDTGATVSLTSDLDRAPRPQGNGYDIGAFELAAGTPDPPDPPDPTVSRGVRPSTFTLTEAAAVIASGPSLLEDLICTNSANRDTVFVNFYDGPVRAAAPVWSVGVSPTQPLTLTAARLRFDVSMLAASPAPVVCSFGVRNLAVRTVR